jgi:5-methyltetrahydropteroyltriglutamate--homocysteine methyltransferase
MLDLGPVAQDVANFKAALTDVEVTEAFITAASPGSVALIMANQYYATTEAYLAALARSP